MRKLELLWAIPLWEWHDAETTQVAHELLEGIASIPTVGTGPSFSYFNYDLECIARAKALLTKLINEALQDEEYPFEVQSFAVGTIGMIHPGECDTPHVHRYPLVGVWYLDAEPDRGDLMLLAPSGTGVLNQTVEAKGTTRRVYKSIAPQTGKLVVFPGEIQHFVMPNMSNKTRVAFAFNVELKRI